MMSLGKRVRELRTKLGYSQDELSRLAGCSRQTIQAIESGIVYLPRKELLNELARFLGTGTEDLLQAAGYLPREGAPRPLDAVVRELEVIQPLAIPIFDQETSAGGGLEVSEYAYWSPPKVAGKNIRGIKVKGSCLAPRVEDGDVVFFDTDATPQNGRLVVALMGDQLMVKRFREQEGRVWLESNEERFQLDDETRIQGVVIRIEKEDWGEVGAYLPTPKEEELLDPDFRLFMDGEWVKFTAEEKEWLKTSVRLIRERKADQQKQGKSTTTVSENQMPEQRTQ
jgi:transcriptional regulator with XRE-family HTH domain